MPATVSRIKMPASNRMHISADRFRHAIWDNMDDQQVSLENITARQAADKANAPDVSMGTNMLAKMTGAALSQIERGRCKKCGIGGHLTVHCRNMLPQVNQEDTIDSTSSDTDTSVGSIEQRTFMAQPHVKETKRSRTHHHRSSSSCSSSNSDYHRSRRRHRSGKSSKREHSSKSSKREHSSKSGKQEHSSKSSKREHSSKSSKREHSSKSGKREHSSIDRHKHSRSVKTSGSKRRHQSPSSSSSSSEDSSQHRHKHHRSSRKRKHDKHKKKRSYKANPGALTQQWGKRGILTPADFFVRTDEFHAWLSEVKNVSRDCISNKDEKEFFSEFMEDFNTCTLPHDKYYDYKKWGQEEMVRRSQNPVETSNAGLFDDEEELRRTNMERRAKHDLERDAAVQHELRKQLRAVRDGHKKQQENRELFFKQ